MKVRIKERPTGYISLAGGPLQEWPEVGAVVDLPSGVAEALIAAGNAEKPAVKVEAERDDAPVVETRPAPSEPVETRRPGRPRKTPE